MVKWKVFCTGFLIGLLPCVATRHLVIHNATMNSWDFFRRLFRRHGKVKRWSFIYLWSDFTAIKKVNMVSEATAGNKSSFARYTVFAQGSDNWRCCANDSTDKAGFYYYHYVLFLLACPYGFLVKIGQFKTCILRSKRFRGVFNEVLTGQTPTTHKHVVWWREKWLFSVFALTSLSFKHFPFLYEISGGSFNISRSNGWFWIKCHLLIKMFFRFGKAGLY